MSSSISIAARLNRLPPTRTHRAATVIAGIGSFFDLFDIFLAGVLGTVLTQEFHLSRLALPAILGSSFVGMFFGATFLGRFADRHGRRTAFLLNLGVYSGFTLLGAASVNAPMLIVTRFLAGIGIGAELPLVDTYLSELLPARCRGRYTTWAYTLGFIGVPAAGFLGRLLVPQAPLGISGWRWMFLAGSLGAAIVWAVRAKLPESPRWIESAGRVQEAEAVVERVDRRWLIVASALLMSVFGLALGYASSATAIVATGFLYTVASNVFSNALHIFQVEILPAFARATAAGTAYGMSRLSSGVMPFVLLPVLERWGATAMFEVIAGALLICVVDIALFAPSTTGRSLEQLNTV